MRRTILTPTGPRVQIVNILTDQDLHWHAALQDLRTTPDEQSAVSEAFRRVRDALAERGMPVALDDRAEACIAAIFRYLTESKLS